MTPLEERTLLVHLAVHQWWGRKTEPLIRDEVRVAKGAATSEDEYKKMLVPRRSLRGVTKAISALRSEHQARTLPWRGDGIRILPSADYFEYVSAINAARFDLDQAVDVFVLNYPALIDNQRLSRGELFNEMDYPPAAEVRAAFRVDVSVLPFPSTSDFRLEGMDVSELRKEIESEINASLSEAVEELRSRLVTAISRWGETLSDPEGVFRDTLWSNLDELVQLAPRLNVTHDQEITRLTEAAQGLLGYTLDELRHDPIKRAQAVVEARGIFEESLV